MNVGDPIVLPEDWRNWQTAVKTLLDRLERVENDLRVGLSSAHTRESALSDALQRTQLSIDFIGVVLHNTEWMDRLQRLVERESRYENIRLDLEEEVSEAQMVLDTLIQERRRAEERTPWWRRLFKGSDQ